jgi:hypothetical protein
MRLFFISPKGCNHITELMPGISSVYQLEQEFSPYLSVEFIPRTELDPGIILIAGKEVVKRNYVFNNPNDLIELRKLIWKYVRKIHNPVDVTDSAGCIKNFIPSQTSQVIQGFQNKKKQMKGSVCCKDLFINEYINASNTSHDTLMHNRVLHDAYKLSTLDNTTRHTCKTTRFKECGDNYPFGTATHNRCVREVSWLCENGYPINVRANLVLKHRDLVKKQVMDYLKKNNMRANKKTMDTIFASGFFENISNRMGNKAMVYDNVLTTVNDLIGNDHDYFSKMVEGYETGDSDHLSTTISETKNKYLSGNLLILLIIIGIIMLHYLLKN